MDVLADGDTDYRAFLKSTLSLIIYKIILRIKLCLKAEAGF